MILYKRAVGGAWTQVTITRFNRSVRQRKRPTVAINGSTGVLYVFSVSQERTEVSYFSAPLSNLALLSSTPPTILVQVPDKHFRNTITPRVPTTGAAGLLVLVDNTTDRTIWRRRLP